MCVPTQRHNREVQGVRQGTDKMIRFGKFNIRNGKSGGLELALCRMA